MSAGRRSRRLTHQLHAYWCLAACAAAASAGMARPAAAQLKSVPVYPAGPPGGTWAAGLEFGSGLDRGSGHARHYGGRLSVALGRLEAAAAGGLWDAGASVTGQVGLLAGVRIRGSARRGLALGVAGGVGYAVAGPADARARYLTLPLAAVMRFQDLPLGPVHGTVWLAPRAEADRVAFGQVRGVQGGLGLAAGVDTQLAPWLGLRGALDGSRVFERHSTGATLPANTRVVAGLAVYLFPGQGR